MKSTQKKTSNVHGQLEKFAFGTQHNLYSTDLHLVSAWGVMQILGLAFLDTNMLVSPARHSGIGGLDQCKAPTRKFSGAVEYTEFAGLEITADSAVALRT